VNLYVGLVHCPVYDKRGKIICTAVTNLDIHDLARCAMTFGVRLAYIINPLNSQRELVRRLVRHWTTGAGAQYNPIRKSALARVRVKATVEDVIQEISEVHQQRVGTVATGAIRQAGALSYRDMKGILEGCRQPFLLLFGTGWGLAREILTGSDFVLAPIDGPPGYNHLSVRSAAAIILDRLLGNR
jgi:hypothetical protein